MILKDFKRTTLLTLFHLIWMMMMTIINSSWSCELEYQNSTLTPIKIPNGVALFLQLEDRTLFLSCGINMTAFNSPYDLIKLNGGQCMTFYQHGQRLLYECSSPTTSQPQKTQPCWIEYNQVKFWPEVMVSGKGKVIGSPLEEILVNCGTSINQLSRSSSSTVRMVENQCHIILNGKSLDFFYCQKLPSTPK